MMAPPDDATRSLHFCNRFAISCGTVTIDPAQTKVLLIHWRKTGEYMLPKGRKDVGETLEAAALRETWEETGYRAELLPVAVDTLATSPTPSTSHAGEQQKASTEPLAVQQRADSSGNLKIIFWYVASGDSTATREEGTTTQENEDFDAIWMDFDKAGEALSFEDDRKIAEAAVTAAFLTAAPDF
ncbi:NUDIX hydrolase domain-like protein [Diplogelasinospora grovesii]|uniref:NUDIX hydrolase domain-like protein n=1 Tax=Diplogelasinospora grovesii TaxID=303347 RepID=A0AAN6MYA7_9PEZI|nr:NUDIX hydrolase domain-like protein [Diplogelasinospora grovesii]